MLEEANCPERCYCQVRQPPGTQAGRGWKRCGTSLLDKRHVRRRKGCVRSVRVCGLLVSVVTCLLKQHAQGCRTLQKVQVSWKQSPGGEQLYCSSPTGAEQKRSLVRVRMVWELVAYADTRFECSCQQETFTCRVLSLQHLALIVHHEREEK